MDYTFIIPHNGRNYYYSLLRNEDFQSVLLEGTIYLDISKYHNHRYVLAGFLYKYPKYIYPKEFKTKKELYNAIQKLLQELL